MSNLYISNAVDMALFPPVIPLEGVLFDKSNRILAFTLDHSLAGVLGAATVTVYGLKDDVWYNLVDVAVNTNDDPAVYDVDLLCRGWERITLSINSLGTIKDLQWELVHECHAAGAR